MSTSEDSRREALQKRFIALAEKWNGRVKVQSPPCEDCGQVKTKPANLPRRKK